MRSTMWIRRVGLAAITGACMYGSIGCAEERDPINRVQDDALPKTFFIGANYADTPEGRADDPEFYMRNTVIDVPYGAGQDGLFTASYSQPTNRIKWEIQQGQLIARQTYEHIANSDGNGSQITDNGQVVAMFNITSQFDIKRDYNPQTGEELNIIDENTTDRPWQERDYIRVDWSQNMVTDGYEVDTLSSLGVIGGVKFDPLQYYYSDPTDPNAPQFDAANGYFDITSKAFATPQIVNTPYGNFPACYFFGSFPVTNCNPTELTLRLSFRQVKDNDFEQTEWDGDRMNAFGWFYQDRYGYDRNYGVVDQQWHHLASKYNIWQRSHITSSPDAVGPATSQELFAQCNTDVWRDQFGNPMTFKVDGNGNFITDGTTGLPIPDPAGKPFSKSTTADIGTDPNADTNGNLTADQCEFSDANGNLLHKGARCDTLANRCSTPLDERQLKTIPWYYAPGGDEDLFQATSNALNEWNIAVKRAALLGQVVEGNRRGSPPAFAATDLTEDLLMADYTNAMTQSAQTGKFVAPTYTDVFVLCHSPVIAADNPACGTPGTYARIGDLRYNTVNLITNPQSPSPWGIMVDADDPLTGEKVVTSVNEWGAVLDIAAQGTEDLLRWINGEISDSQITSGQYMLDWLQATQGGTSMQQPSAMSSQQIKDRLTSLHAAQITAKATPSSQAVSYVSSQQNIKTMQQRAQAAQGPSLDATFQGSIQTLIGSQFESQLVTPDMLQAAGYDPSTPVAGDSADASALSQASWLRGMNPEMHKWLQKLSNNAVQTSASCSIEQPEPDSLVGMARLAQKLYPLPDKTSSAACQFDASIQQSDYSACKFKRDSALHQWIREQFHTSVILHEMGHSMGLRHNFSGSWDALNYHTQYWQLRTRNGVEKGCATTDTNSTNKDVNGDGVIDIYDAYPFVSHTDGSDCVGPRWVDPVTDQEVNGLVWKWGSSTVMDYPGDQTQDMNDIGLYDKAAMRFGYANLVDVDADTKIPATAPTSSSGWNKGLFYMERLDGFGGIIGPTDGYCSDTTASGKPIPGHAATTCQGLHYSQFQDQFKVLGTCSSQTDATDPLSATCTGIPLQQVSYYDLQDYQDATAAGGVRPFAIAPKGAMTSTGAPLTASLVRHPYLFGSDEFADFGNIPVFRFDSGADPYEQEQFIMSTYENRYIFDMFRRNRTLFNTGTVVGRVQSRYFDKLTASTKGLGLYSNLISDPDGFSQLTNDVAFMLPHALASGDSFATFIRVLTRPEPGNYYTNSAIATNYAEEQDTAPQEGNFTANPLFNIAVGSGEGRYLHNDYDYTKGYNWSDYQTQVGSYYEKVVAIYYLTEAYNHFIQNSKEDYIDSRSLNINYATLYPQQMRRIFANMMQSDPTTLGPYVATTTTSTSSTAPIARVQYLPWDTFNEASANNTLSYPSTSTIIAPLVGWEEQFPGLMYGFFFGGTTLTMDWVQQMRIYSPGGGDTVSVPVSQQFQYTDPMTGVQYIAINYGTEEIGGKQVFTTSGTRMLQYAKQLAMATFKYTPDPVTGEPIWENSTTDTTAPVCAIATAACNANQATLRGYSANIDTLRQLSAYLGYGPIGRTE